MNANTTPEPAEIFALAHGSWRASVSTLGAALLDLWNISPDGRDLTIVTSEWPDAHEWFAGVALAPWVNRLDRGRWHHENHTLQAPLNDPRNDCANHGLAFDQVFTVKHHSPDSITLTLELRHEAYPFDVEFAVTYTLTNQGLRGTLAATNRGSEAAPIAVGAHPYLLTEPGSRFEFTAGARMNIDERMLPTGDSQNFEGAVANQQILTDQKAHFTDACFTALDHDDSGKFVAGLTRPSHAKRILIWQQREFSHLQVFTLMHPEIAGGHTLLALEPQTAGANALNTGHDLVWIDANETWQGTWGISIEEMSTDGK